jgi:hypothetical protein
MASALSQLLAGLTPPPVINPVEYDGLEYRWNMFVFRPARELSPIHLLHYANSKITVFKPELYLLTAVLVYVAVIFIGSSINSAKANKWHVVMLSPISMLTEFSLQVYRSPPNIRAAVLKTTRQDRPHKRRLYRLLQLLYRSAQCCISPHNLYSSATSRPVPVGIPDRKDFHRPSIPTPGRYSTRLHASTWSLAPRLCVGRHRER